jgi:hypothetical protein
VIAYKFLARGTVSPFSRAAWPRPVGSTPGAWVTASPGFEPWIHGCRPADLPYWIDAELWRAELSDPARPVRHEVRADRARLLERMEAWGPAARREFTVQCVLRTAGFAAEALRGEGLDSEARTLSSCETVEDVATAVKSIGRGSLPERSHQLLGYCGDAAVWSGIGDARCVPYIASIAAADLRGDAGAMEEERSWQARWLSDRLGIGP